MAWNFRKRITLFPGLRLNLSGSGVSVSVGPRGANFNFSQRGVTGNLSIPGTGLYKREKIGSSTRKKGTSAIVPPFPIEPKGDIEPLAIPKCNRASSQTVRIETLLKYRDVIKESKVELLEALLSEGHTHVVISAGEIESLCALQKAGSEVKRIISFKECSNK